MSNPAFRDLRKLLAKDRTVRRFINDKPIGRDTLTELVDLTRLCASGRNAQPLRYRLVCNPDECAKIYPLLKWAGYYTYWDGPEAAERPVAYMVQCLDTTLGNDVLCDDGLQLQTITLGARTLGIGCCIIKAFNAPALAEALGIPDRYKPRYVLALGYPADEPIIVDMPSDGDFRYFRREDGRHCVPKRPLSDLII